MVKPKHCSFMVFIVVLHCWLSVVVRDVVKLLSSLVADIHSRYRCASHCSQDISLLLCWLNFWLNVLMNSSVTDSHGFILSLITEISSESVWNANDHSLWYDHNTSRSLWASLESSLLPCYSAASVWCCRTKSRTGLVSIFSSYMLCCM